MVLLQTLLSKREPEVATDGGDRAVFGGSINTMAEQKFPGVYAGVRMKPEADGTVAVFAAKGQDDGAFLAALDALMKDAGPGNNGVSWP